MELTFPFKNITANSFLHLTDDRENIFDFILTKKDDYPYSENFFLKRVLYFRNGLPNFENEILQIINTTNQRTIDVYFTELLDNITLIKERITLQSIKDSVVLWNIETIKTFEHKIEKETDDYFKSEDRKRKHLEEFEGWDYDGFGLLGGLSGFKKIKRTNYNFYCIETKPELIDESYCEEYQVFLEELANEYLEIALRYIIPYKQGKIVSKSEEFVFNKPVVFVEGEHDITFIKKAAELLNKTDILEKIELRQRNGWTNLDKIWEIYKDNNWETIPQKKLLLYDCDTKKKDEETGMVYKRVIPTIENSVISKGIENLFPETVVHKARLEKNEFIDVVRIHTIKRGVITNNTTCEVNKDEKKNFCNWICENGTAEDFINFEKVFELICLVI